MILENKVAVVYGAGGGIGGAVARAFAREGARVFLTGRHRAAVEAITKDIVSAGGIAETAEVDALEEKAIDEHLESVVRQAGRVDISFNAVGIPDQKLLGVPAVELDLEQFLLPLRSYTTSYFLTARLAARRMVPNRSGVIMTVSALHSRIGLPFVGGYGPAQAAKEALTRHLSAELAPHGIRVVGLRPQAMLETGTIKNAFEPRARATAHEARRDGQRGGVHGVRRRERHDGDDRQPDDGEPGRLAVSLRPKPRASSSPTRAWSPRPPACCRPPAWSSFRRRTRA